MANVANVEAIQEYSKVLDEVYAKASFTSVFDTQSFKPGANALEYKIPKVDTPDMGAYNKNSGYAEGTGSYTYETVSVDADRSTSFDVDALDNDVASAGLAFVSIASETVRTKAVPEIDTYRLAKYGALGTSSYGGYSEALTTGEQALEALQKVMTMMDNQEVPSEGRHLFIIPSLYNAILALDSYKSRAMLARFEEANVHVVPTSRMVKTAAFNSSTGALETSGSTQILVIHPDAIIQVTNRLNTKVLLPEQQKKDAYTFCYRQVSVNNALENKVAGIGRIAFD